MQDKMQALQLVEQQIQHLASQRQTLQLQISEIDSALEELKVKEEAYKMVAGIMIKYKSVDLNKSLTQQIKVFKLRIDKLETQEEKLGGKAQKLQKELLKEMGGKNE